MNPFYIAEIEESSNCAHHRCGLGVHTCAVHVRRLFATSMETAQEEVEALMEQANPPSSVTVYEVSRSSVLNVQTTLYAIALKKLEAEERAQLALLLEKYGVPPSSKEEVK